MIPERKETESIVKLYDEAMENGREPWQQRFFNEGWNACLDEVEREYGYWIAPTQGESQYYTCSVCGYRQLPPCLDFCPKCGARLLSEWEWNYGKRSKRRSSKI